MENITRQRTFAALLALALITTLTRCSVDLDLSEGIAGDAFSICEAEGFDPLPVEATLIGKYALLSELDCSIAGCRENVTFPIATVVLELLPNGVAEGAFLRDSLATWTLESPVVEGAAHLLRFESTVKPNEDDELYSITGAGVCRLRLENGQLTAVLGRLIEN